MYIVSPNGISQTYANRGLGHTDYHNYRFGSHANYNRYNILADLQDIISSYLPDQICVTSEFDVHPDHSTTYQLVSMAVQAVHSTNANFVPVINKTIVHWGDPNAPVTTWPQSLDPTSYIGPIPNLETLTNLLWADRESIDVPLPMQSTDLSTNPKYEAVVSIVSQGGVTYELGDFIHKDEIFWTENIVGANQPPIVNAGVDQAVTQGDVVYLDGSQSKDPDGTALSFQWVQRSGPTVQLSNPASVNPSFTAPTGLTQDETLTFELVVSDGQLSSLPDSVNVQVYSQQPNIAPLATVTASSETTQYGQTAVKAVDGVIDGYPGDYTKEWATAGEQNGAWLKLTWSVPYSVSRVILYDRPNLE